jgi:hypothetical protein
MYGRTEHEWQELEQAGWDFLKEKAAERRGDAAHDPTVSYGNANEELATRTGQPSFDFGQQVGRAAMGYLLGRISRNRSWPISHLLISALVCYQGEASVRAYRRLWSVHQRQTQETPGWTGTGTGTTVTTDSSP